MLFTSPLQNALIFSVQTIFSAYISIVLLRFILQLVRANIYNPFAQFALKVTNPVLMPVRKIIPKFRKIDLAALLLAIILQMAKIILILLIKGFSVAFSVSAIGGILIWSCGEIIDLLLIMFLLATFIHVILSWIAPNQYNPAAITIGEITDPLFTPVRRVVPTIGMLDLSPIIVIFLITLSRMLIADPIILLGENIFR